MSNLPEVRFNYDLLPSLGGLIPGSKNLLSPLSAPFKRPAAAGEIQGTGLLDAQGRLRGAYLAAFQTLANPSSAVDLRLLGGGVSQQFALYYGQPGAPPVLLMPTSNHGVLLKLSPDIEAILNGLMHFCSDSFITSFEFEASLPNGPALALAALADMHRRSAARAFADLAPVGTISVSTGEIADWIARCPVHYQWFTVLVRQAVNGSTDPRNLQADLNDLVRRGICQQTGNGYALAGGALEMGNRMILIDNVFTLDVARMAASDRIGVVSVSALQAGINDLLHIEIQEDGITFTGLCAMAFVEQVRHYLEKGGAELPDISEPQVQSQAQPQAQPQAALTCNGCGHQLSPTTRFCPKCGAPVQRKCPHCGNQLSSTARFCANCGGAVD